jgi:hypothetical protein
MISRRFGSGNAAASVGFDVAAYSGFHFRSPWVPPSPSGDFVGMFMVGFTDKGRNAQQLYYQPTGASFETIIDIIPFGKLETTERTIARPP